MSAWVCELCGTPWIGPVPPPDDALSACCGGTVIDEDPPPGDLPDEVLMSKVGGRWTRVLYPAEGYRTFRGQITKWEEVE